MRSPPGRRNALARFRPTAPGRSGWAGCWARRAPRSKPIPAGSARACRRHSCLRPSCASRRRGFSILRDAGFNAQPGGPGVAGSLELHLRSCDVHARADPRRVAPCDSRRGRGAPRPGLPCAARRSCRVRRGFSRRRTSSSVVSTPCSTVWRTSLRPAASPGTARRAVHIARPRVTAQQPVRCERLDHLGALRRRLADTQPHLRALERRFHRDQLLAVLPRLGAQPAMTFAISPPCTPRCQGTSPGTLRSLIGCERQRPRRNVNASRGCCGGAQAWP